MSTPHNKRSNEEFIDLSNKVHNNFYDYSKTDYKNNRTPVTIICPDHGDFPQRPEHHLNGSGCPECKGNKKLTTKTFIENANKIHNNFYDYSNVEYKCNKIEVDIMCPIHGHVPQRPDSHLRGIGCKFCGQKKSADSQRKSLETFIIEANKVHGFKYNYTNSIYNGAHKDIVINCLKHGDFTQTPNSHLRGCGCPNCIETYGERNVRIFLQENNFNFIYQKPFSGCIYKGLLKFDFYLPEYNMCIEYDGEQHFSPYYVFGGEDALKIQKIKDNIKTDYCKNNNIQLFRISYNDNFNNKIKELLEILSKK